MYVCIYILCVYIYITCIYKHRFGGTKKMEGLYPRYECFPNLPFLSCNTGFETKHTSDQTLSALTLTTGVALKFNSRCVWNQEICKEEQITYIPSSQFHQEGLLLGSWSAGYSAALPVFQFSTSTCSEHCTGSFLRQKLPYLTLQQ